MRLSNKKTMELQGNILELLAPETRTFKSYNTGEDVEYTSRVLLLYVQPLRRPD